MHSIFINSLQPLYTVGTSASLVSIKYKETTTNLQRYEAQPGARNFRRMFSHNASSNTDSDEEYNVFGTTPSSSSSSCNKNHSIIPTIPEDDFSVGSTPKLSFLTRNHSKHHHSRKPKTNITKTNSSFVQKIITNDQLAKILMSRTNDDTNLFYNCGTSFIWMDASGNPKVSSI
jgi:spore germination protein YaaH